MFCVNDEYVSGARAFTRVMRYSLIILPAFSWMTRLMTSRVTRLLSKYPGYAIYQNNR